MIGALLLATTMLLGRTDTTKVNDYLSYDASAKVVYLTIAAGHEGANGGMSFNGGFDGKQTITIPKGWRVEGTFTNEDGNVPHSALVIAEVNPVPLSAATPVFTGAQTKDPEGGIEAGGKETMSFTADTEGNFWLFCGVTSHGQNGMYLKLVVSSSATVPTYS
jgi:sulfocyanin